MSRDPAGTPATPTTRNGRYRKLYPRIWNSRDFLKLSEGDRLIALYVLTGPQTNRIGCVKFSIGAAAEDFLMPLGAFRRRFLRVIASFKWQFDEKNRVLWIPSWWKFNAPEGPNQLKGALRDLADVPQSPLKALFCQHFDTLPTETLRQTFRETLTETFGSTFNERSPKPSPIQDQEQERDQEQEGARGEGSPKPNGRSNGGVVSGALPRDHVGHAACDDTHSRCVPRQVHDKLANLLAPRYAGNRQAAKATLLAWYPSIWATLPATFVMPDAFKFWQGHFDRAFATKGPVAATTSPSPPGCRHTPRCVDEVTCTERRLAAQRSEREEISRQQPAGRPS